MSNKVKRSWDYLSEEQRRRITDKIIDYFRKERNEEIGAIAAGNILDFFLETAGGVIYNAGLEDVKKFLEEKFDGINLDIDISLRKTDKI